MCILYIQQMSPLLFIDCTFSKTWTTILSTPTLWPPEPLFRRSLWCHIKHQVITQFLFHHTITNYLWKPIEWSYLPLKNTNKKMPCYQKLYMAQNNIRRQHSFHKARAHMFWVTMCETPSPNNSLHNQHMFLIIWNNRQTQWAEKRQPERKSP